MNYLYIPNAAWITWEVQIRNRSMAKALGVPLFEILSNKSRILKYPELVCKTLKVIRAQKVKILFVQNPSIVLSFLAVVLKSIFKLTVIVDAHNAGIYPLEGRNKFLNFIARFISKKADYVIVSNTYLADVVRGWAGEPLVIPDPIPKLQLISTNEIKSGKPYVFFVCTWADDEPFQAVIEAAKMVDVDIYFTGNYKKFFKDGVPDIPSNVKLLGFVSEERYIEYFHHSIIAMDLTTRENCLVCGAYEALALKKPMVLSDSLVNRELFSQGFVYTANTSEAIGKSILAALDEHTELENKISELKEIYELRHSTIITGLKEKLFNSDK
jgi:glycosyltransferase involved in cell wall biosynthesis